MSAPELWFVAGPNGAGKTTLVRTGILQEHVEGAVFFNADEMTLGSLRMLGYEGFHDAPVPVLKEEFVKAAEQVFNRAAAMVDNGGRLVIETVLSTPKYRSLVERTHALGGSVGLIYVAVRSPEVSAERIGQRVIEGGHDVPYDKLLPRWKNSLVQLTWFAAWAHEFWVFDNTDMSQDRQPVLVAHGRLGQAEFFAPDAIPELTEALRNAAFVEG